MTKKLFQHLPLVDKKIKQASKVYLFLDYDGTLVGFQKKPDMVKTPEKVTKVLQKLAERKKFNVFIITGRTLEDIKNLVKIKGLNYAAVHGIKIQTSDMENFVWKKAKKLQVVIEKIREKSLKNFKDYQGVIVEDKKFTLALHYRNQKESENAETVDEFKKIVNLFDENNELDILYGSKVVEVRPKGWDKGKAVEHILEKSNGGDDFIVYIGDDTTDEDAFRLLDKKNLGLSVYVVNGKKRGTNADFVVKNPDYVFRFLRFFLIKVTEG